MGQDKTPQPLPQQAQVKETPQADSSEKDKPEQPPIITDYASL